MADTPKEVREAARKRIAERRAFVPHLIIYLVFNAGLVLLWVSAGGDGLFWPGLVIVAWGIGVLMHAWNAFFNKPISEVDVDRELQRAGYRTEAEHPS